MREYIVLLDDSSTVSVFANKCQWDENTIEFSIENEPDDEHITSTIVGAFYTEHVIGWYRKYEEPNTTELLALGGKINE